MFCINCGNQNIEEAKFCEHCGHHVNMPHVATTHAVPVAVEPQRIPSPIPTMPAPSQPFSPAASAIPISPPVQHVRITTSKPSTRTKMATGLKVAMVLVVVVAIAWSVVIATTHHISGAYAAYGSKLEGTPGDIMVSLDFHEDGTVVVTSDNEIGKCTYTQNGNQIVMTGTDDTGKPDVTHLTLSDDEKILTESESGNVFQRVEADSNQPTQATALPIKDRAAMLAIFFHLFKPLWPILGAGVVLFVMYRLWGPKTED